MFALLTLTDVEIFLDDSPELLSMFDYMATGCVHSDFAAALDAEVQNIKTNEEQRSRYMSLATSIEDMQDDGYAEGKDDGIRAVAQRLLQGGMPLKQVVSYTGLTEGQVRELRQQ